MPIIGIQASSGKKPSTPTFVSASAGSSQASVSFTPSTYIGKSTIMYVATSTPGSITGTSSSSPITVSGLSNGTPYTFTVTGVTDYGVSSDISNVSNQVTPAAPVYYAPPVYYAAPVYYAPPVYYAAPVYYAPPVYYAAPVYYAPPVYYAAPVYYAPEPVYYAPPPAYYAPPCIPTPADFCGSLGGGTYVLTLNGYKSVNTLAVGDELLSLDVTEIPTFGPGFDLTAWASEQFTNNGVTSTTITDISVRDVNHHVLINGDWFSESHYILARKDGVHSFVMSANMDTSYEVYNYQTEDWVQVTDVIHMDVTMSVYSINCEPYDIFFTENMLVYNMREFY